ncbi:MAG: hypothetical protein KA164_18195 [Rhodoferax sp.]|nr:hypothetical protein [Rhodoferax sp.]
MKHWHRRWLQAGLAAAVVVCMAWFAARFWLGSADFRGRVESAASAQAGVPVRLGRVALDAWPVPGVALEKVRIETQPAITVERIEARAQLSALVSGRLVLSSLRVERADVTQAGWDDLSERRSKKPGPQAADAGSAALVLPAQLVVDHLTWRPLDGAPMELGADVSIGPEGLPDTLSLKMLGRQFLGADIRLARRALTWDVDADYAGGRIQGDITLDKRPTEGAVVAVTGRLSTEGLQLGIVTRQRLTGLLSAQTTLGWRSGQPGPALNALQTQSTFTVRNAVLSGIDLARAVKTVGLSRGGETRLDTLAGQVGTRGRAVNFNQLVASSGALSANGQVALSPSQALRGRVVVHLGPAALGQAVGVPLVVGGTLDAPALTLTRSALLGAAIGTMVMPGVGTGAGASMGDKIGDKLQDLFGK